MGVATTEVHLKIEEVLRSKLEEEIEKVDIRRKEGFDGLSKLLIQGWEARDVPELRPVLITVIKKMAEKTPTQLLQRLADREEDGTLKYADLFAQFGISIKRLVWEADWERSIAATLNDDDPGKDKNNLPSSLLSDLLDDQIQKYCDDLDLNLIADVSFVGSKVERKVLTQHRRSATNVVTSNLSTTNNIIGKKDDRGSTRKLFGSSAGALAKIKEIIGDRPNLLAAMFHILIHKHGKNAKTSNTEGNKILGGRKYLPCTLVTDVLLSFGPLPKQYEFLGMLAKILDDSVRIGILSDDSIAQIQGCLRAIIAQSASNADMKKKSDSSSSDNPSAAISSSTAIKPVLPSKPKKYDPKEDKTYVASFLQEVIHSAIDAMKETDAKLVFLNPVTDAIAPGYSRVISKPMCILTISQKNNSKAYHSLKDFEKDVELMFSNCIKYNVGADGVWFRGEAKRQRDMFKKSIIPQAKGFWKKEIAERKKIMEKDYEKTWLEEKKKAREENAKLKKTKLLTDEQRTLGITSAKNSDLAITRLSAADISILPPTKIKKKRKEPSTTIHIGSGTSKDDSSDQPSTLALATMMLSDPFVVRLVLEKIYRTIRTQVLKEKSVFLPSCDIAIPSLYQLLHIAQGSTQLCAIKGRKFTVPDAGMSKEAPQSNTATITINFKQEKEERYLNYSTLRVYTPRFAEFLLTLHIDDRLSIQGDLNPVLSSPSGSLSPMPPTSPKQWENTSSLLIIRSLAQYVLVYKFVGNNRNSEKLAVSLQAHLPRLQIVLHALSGGNMRHERTFWRSLVGGLLNWKRKLGVKVRDLMVDFWIEWFKVEKTEDEDDEGCLSAPVHEMFIFLLNEWASLGNLILPRDKLLSLSTKAVEEAEPRSSKNSSTGLVPRPFAKAWLEDGSEFALVKAQYETMLKNVSGTHAEEWKKSMGIDDESLKHNKK